MGDLWKFVIYLCVILVIRINATTRTYDLVIRHDYKEIAGYSREIITVNGQMPGPKIWANEGDRLIINVKNELHTSKIAIHWHGQRQKGTPYMDGTTSITQCGINPMETYVYNFTTEYPGTFWYHSHSDGQYPDGLLGPLIVYPKVDLLAGQYDEEIIMFLQDWMFYDGSQIISMMMANNLRVVPGLEFIGPQTPESYAVASILINGKGWNYAPLIPDMAFYNSSKTSDITIFKVEKGKKYLVRVINAASIANLQLYISNHSQKFVEVDSTLIKPINSQNGMHLEVAQRTSFILEANQPIGNYYIQVPLPDAIGLPIFQNYIGLGIIHYEGASNPVLPKAVGSGKWPDVPLTPAPDVNIASDLIPLIPNPPPLNVTKNFILVIDAVDQFFTLNGKTFRHPTGNYLLDRFLGKPINEDVPHIDISYGDVVDVTLINQGFTQPINHPFHLHGHDFWVIGSGYGAVNTSNYNLINPIYRDTTLVSIDPFNGKSGWLTIRFIADNPGVWHFHCHMEWHLVMGLAIIFNEALDRLPPPLANTPLCGVNFQELYGSPIQHTCIPNVSQSAGNSWNDGNYIYQIFNLEIKNIGAAPLLSSSFKISLTAFLIVNSSWNLLFNATSTQLNIKTSTPWGLLPNNIWSAGYILRRPLNSTYFNPKITLVQGFCF